MNTNAVQTHLTSDRWKQHDSYVINSHSSPLCFFHSILLASKYVISSWLMALLTCVFAYVCVCLPAGTKHKTILEARSGLGPIKAYPRLGPKPSGEQGGGPVDPNTQERTFHCEICNVRVNSELQLKQVGGRNYALHLSKNIMNQLHWIVIYKILYIQHNWLFGTS